MKSKLTTTLARLSLGYILALSLALLVAARAAQEAHDPLSQVPAEKRKQRLESWRFDVKEWKFFWSISEGYVDEEGKYRITKLRPEYEIRLEDAQMAYEGDVRKFSPQEAENVSQLFALVARYAMESTLWWEQGKGDPVDGKKNRADSRNTQRNVAGAGDLTSGPSGGTIPDGAFVLGLDHNPILRSDTRKAMLRR